MKRPVAGLLAGLLAAIPPFPAAVAPAVADDFASDVPAASQMAEAMWDMMDWMRGENGGPFRFSTDSMPGMSPGFGNFGWPAWGMTGMPSYMDGMPMMKNFGDVYEASPWSRLPDQMERFQRQDGWVDDPYSSHSRTPDAAGMMPPTSSEPARRGAPAASRLDGIWRGASGETFMIEGDRFRLADAAGDYLDGRIQVSGDRVRTYLPINGQVRNYRYVKVGRMLMLRDESDQTLVFERVYR